MFWQYCFRLLVYLSGGSMFAFFFFASGAQYIAIHKVPDNPRQLHSPLCAMRPFRDGSRPHKIPMLDNKVRWENRFFRKTLANKGLPGSSSICLCGNACCASIFCFIFPYILASLPRIIKAGFPRLRWVQSIRCVVACIVYCVDPFHLP